MDTDSGRYSPSVEGSGLAPPVDDVDIGQQSADDVTVRHIQRAAASLLVLHDSVDEEEIQNYLEQLDSCVLHGNGNGMLQSFTLYFPLSVCLSVCLF